MIYNLEESKLIKKQRLKIDIKKTAGKCAMILLLLSISTYFFGIIMVNIIKLRGETLVNNYNNNEMIFGISKEGYNFLVGYLPCILADIVAIVACILTFKHRIKDYILSKKEISPIFILSGSFASIGVGIISSIVFLVYSLIINSQGIEIPSPDFSIPKSTIYIILFFSYTCVIAPVFEEIIFRGYILNNMRKYGNITAILVSSIFFSMFHSNLVQLVNPILMGIILSFIAIKSESILPSIMVHMFNNILAMLTTVISFADSQVIISIWSSIYYLVGMLSLFFFIFKYGKEFSYIAREKYKLIRVRKKIFYSFFNKWSILYILFYMFIVGVTIIEQNT